MLTIPYNPLPRNRVPWLVSAALHLAGAILLIQYRWEIFTLPANRAAATPIFLAPPPVELRTSTPPRPKLRPFVPPPSHLPQPAISVQILADAPVLRSAPAAVVPTLPAASLPPPPSPVRTGVLDAPPKAAVPQAGSVQAAVVRPSGFDGGAPPKARNEPNSALTLQPAGFDRPTPQGTPAKPGHAVSAAGFGGAAAVAPSPRPSGPGTVGEGGFGSATVAAAGPRPGGPGAVAEGGFGSASVPVSAGGSLQPRRQATQSGFGDIATAKPANHRPAAPPQPDSKPVEITFKPRPAYTAEARRLQIEGEVAIEVIFTATGEVQVVRILRPLGHGLNESATAAARSIRFRPAQQRGRPVDSTAIVRMSFELAY